MKRIGRKEKKMKFSNCIAIITIILSGTLVQAAIFTEDSHIESDNRRYIGQDIIIDGCSVTIDGEHIFNSLRLIHGGVITHSARFTPALHIIIQNDTFIDNSSTINVTEKGYGPATGPGRGNTGIWYGAGAGHGGAGGQSYNNNEYGASGGTVYGAPKYSLIFGSGGGGGRISIYADRNNFFGIVSVDGGNGYEDGEEGTIVYGD